MVVDQAAVGQARTDRVFAALADPTRRDILARAGQREESVSALARRYPISLPAVQKHVAVLEQAELVEKRRRGREQIVRVRTDGLREARSALDRLESMWQQRITRFGEVLADVTEGETP